jgi:hypothetical protein
MIDARPKGNEGFATLSQTECVNRMKNAAGGLRAGKPWGTEKTLNILAQLKVYAGPEGKVFLDPDLAKHIGYDNPSAE